MRGTGRGWGDFPLENPKEGGVSLPVGGGGGGRGQEVVCRELGGGQFFFFFGAEMSTKKWSNP